MEYMSFYIKFKIRKIILTINQTNFIIVGNKLHSELSILSWILYQVAMMAIETDISNIYVLTIHYYQMPEFN